MSRRGQLIVFHYRILCDKKSLTFQKIYLGLGSDDIAYARTMLDDSGWSKSMGALSGLDLLDRRLLLSSMMTKKDGF